MIFKNLGMSNLRFFLALLVICFWTNNALASCNKIGSAFTDFLFYVDFGSSLYIDPATPEGTVIAQQIIDPGAVLYAQNGGWVGLCNNSTNNQIGYWWLEQHNSATKNSNRPAEGVTAPTPDGHMYVLKDNGKNNPYGGSGSGSVGYTVELLSAGQTLPFSEIGGSPPINIAPLATGSPISGIPCAEAKDVNNSYGYPPYTGSCSSSETVFNWRQLGSFSIKVTLYRLKGIVSENMVSSGNDGDRSISLMSLMDTSSTLPSYNKNMFNLTRLALANPIAINTAPCTAFNSPTVNLNKVNKSAFTEVGQPGRNISNTPVNISAQCSANTAVKWAIMGTSDSSDSSGAKGILALDTMNNMAKGVGIQLVDNLLNPLPITPENSVNYKWIDTNLVTNSSGILSVDFLARYVQTGVVEAGIANSHAYLIIAPK